MVMSITGVRSDSAAVMSSTVTKNSRVFFFFELHPSLAWYCIILLITSSFCSFNNFCCCYCAVCAHS